MKEGHVEGEPSRMPWELSLVPQASSIGNGSDEGGVGACRVHYYLREWAAPAMTTSETQPAGPSLIHINENVVTEKKD